MIQCIIDKTIRLEKVTNNTFLTAPLVSGNSLAHMVRLRVLDSDGEPADLTGISATGAFNRPDGHQVTPINVTITGNVVECVFPASCYTTAGRFRFMLDLNETVNNETALRTAFVLDGLIEIGPTGSVVDPGTPVPNIQAAIANAQLATTAANTAAQTATTAAAAAQDVADNVEGEVSALKSAVLPETVNTLDAGTITNGKYVSGDGATQINSNSAYTDFIAVTPGATMTLNGVSLNSLKSVVAYKTANSNSIQKQRLDDGSTVTGSFTCTLPDWAHYVRATTSKDGTVTGSETLTENKVAELRADVDAERADIDAIQTFLRPTAIGSGIKATLTRPVTMTGLDDVTVYAHPYGYGVTAKPSDYKNATGTALYVDATNGADTNAGTAAAPLKTIAAAVTAGANTIYLAAGTYTAPENGFSASVNLIGLDSGVIISGGAAFTGDINIYLEGIDFNGGSSACSLIVGASTETPQLCAYRCIFRGATSGNGLTIKGEATVRLFDCVAHSNYHDGYNYHKNTEISPASNAPNVLEVNCEAYGNGDSNSSPTSDNGSTAHNYTQIIRVNGYYHHNHGGNIADNGNTKAWCLGCVATDSAPTTGNVNNADFWANASAVMYCEMCASGGSTYDAWAEETSTIYVAGGNIANSHTDSGSSVTTYTSTAEVAYSV